MESKKISLNLGCGIALKGEDRERIWVNVDACFALDDLKEKRGICRNAVVPEGAIFHQANIIEMPFPDDYADYALLDNVIEHFPYHVVPLALKEIHRVLKPGAEFCVIAPDFNCLCRLWLDHVASKTGFFNNWDLYHYLAEPIYGNQAGLSWGEFHHTPITPDFLNWQLAAAGFEDIQISMHPMDLPCVPSGDGTIYPPTATNRTDNLKAVCRKPAPATLSFAVSEDMKVKGGLA